MIAKWVTDSSKSESFDNDNNLSGSVRLRAPRTYMTLPFRN